MSWQAYWDDWSQRLALDRVLYDNTVQQWLLALAKESHPYTRALINAISRSRNGLSGSISARSRNTFS